jgi:hypothetical protein
MEQAVKKTGRNKGHTLAAVIVFLLLVTLLWRGSLSQQGSYFRIEKACRVQQAGRDGSIHSLAWALTLLETGLPPKSRYSCLMVSPVDANEIFVATFAQRGRIDYTVDIRLATAKDASLPMAPKTFEQVEPRPRPERPERPGRPREPKEPGRQGRGRSNKNGQQKDTKQSKEPRGAKESGQSGQKEKSQKGKK